MCSWNVLFEFSIKKSFLVVWICRIWPEIQQFLIEQFQHIRLKLSFFQDIFNVHSWCNIDIKSAILLIKIWLQLHTLQMYLYTSIMLCILILYKMLWIFSTIFFFRIFGIMVNQLYYNKFYCLLLLPGCVWGSRSLEQFFSPNLRTELFHCTYLHFFDNTQCLFHIKVH